ncbi:putative actinidain [Helianthus anomalus]
MALWKRSSLSVLLGGRRLLSLPPPPPPISRYHSKGGFVSPSEEEEEIIKRRFEAWAVEHGKSYKTLEEKEKRFKIFREKLRTIERHNFKFPDYCKRELTKFSDQTWEEIRRIYGHN